MAAGDMGRDWPKVLAFGLYVPGPSSPPHVVGFCRPHTPCERHTHMKHTCYDWETYRLKPRRDPPAGVVAAKLSVCRSRKL